MESITKLMWYLCFSMIFSFVVVNILQFYFRMGMKKRIVFYAGFIGAIAWKQGYEMAIYFAVPFLLVSEVISFVIARIAKSIARFVNGRIMQKIGTGS